MGEGGGGGVVGGGGYWKKFMEIKINHRYKVYDMKVGLSTGH